MSHRSALTIRNVIVAAEAWAVGALPNSNKEPSYSASAGANGSDREMSDIPPDDLFHNLRQSGPYGILISWRNRPAA